MQILRRVSLSLSGFFLVAPVARAQRRRSRRWRRWRSRRRRKKGSMKRGGGGWFHMCTWWWSVIFRGQETQDLGIHSKHLGVIERLSCHRRSIFSTFSESRHSLVLVPICARCLRPTNQRWRSQYWYNMPKSFLFTHRRYNASPIPTGNLT